MKHPVSQSFLIPRHSRTASIAAIADAIAAIDAVHTDGNLPAVTVRVMSMGAGEEGYYKATPPRVIAVARSAKRPGLAFVHEVGHLLDNHAFGDGTRFASSTNAQLTDWRGAVTASTAFRSLQSLKDDYRNTIFAGHLAYLLTREELWARSYTQFISLKSGDAQLAAELDQVRIRNGPVYISRHWDNNDFAPIADAISTLFRRKGWMG